MLVVDDGSSDETGAIVRAMAKRDPRIRLLTQAHQGVAAARNHGIRAARGAYIAPLDADDIWYPRKLEQQLRVLRTAGPNVGLVYVWSAYIDEHGDLTGHYYAHALPRNLAAVLIFRNVIGCSSVPLIRRACFDDVGFYNENYVKRGAQGCEDLDLYLRIAERYDFSVVNQFLVGYRQSKRGMSSHTGAMARSFYFVMRDCSERRPDIPWSVFRWSLARQCYYLQECARGYRQPWSTLALLVAAVRFDPHLLLQGQFYSNALAGFWRRITLRDVVPAAPTAPASLATIEARRAERPTVLFDVFASLYQRRLHFTEALLDPTPSATNAVHSPDVGPRLGARRT